MVRTRFVGVGLLGLFCGEVLGLCVCTRIGREEKAERS
jgi:hypothetical protein